MVILNEIGGIPVILEAVLVVGTLRFLVKVILRLVINLA